VPKPIALASIGVACIAALLVVLLSIPSFSSSLLSSFSSPSSSIRPQPDSKNLTLYIKVDSGATPALAKRWNYIPVSNETVDKYPLLRQAIENASSHSSLQCRFASECTHVDIPVYYPSISYSEGLAIVNALHLRSLSLNDEGGTSEIWYNNKTGYYVRIEYPATLTVVDEGKTPSKYRGPYMDEVPDQALDQYPTLAYAISQLENYTLSGNNSTGKIHFEPGHPVDEPAYPFIHLPMTLNESNAMLTDNNPDLLRFLPTTARALYGDHIHYEGNYYTVTIALASGGGLIP